MKKENLPIEVQEIALRVPKEKQNEVQKVLNDIFGNTAEWEQKVDAIEVKDIYDSFNIGLANTARLNAKKARLNGEKIFDAKRAEVQQEMSAYKLEDQLWLKSKQIMQLKLKAIEEKAKYKADYVKRYESEQHELKITERLNQILPFNPEIVRQDIDHLTDEAFGYMLDGIKAKLAAEKAEAERIEKERIAAEKAEKERIAKIEAENKRLAIEAEKRAKEEQERIAKEKVARELAEKEARKERDKLEAKIKAEQAAKEKMQKELEAKEKVARELAEKEARLKELDLQKGDSEKFKDFIYDLSMLKTKYTFESKLNTAKYSKASLLIDKIINFIK